MSRMSDLYIELEGYVADAIHNGADTVPEIMDYLHVNHLGFPIPYDEEIIDGMVQEMEIFYNHPNRHSQVPVYLCYGHA